MKLKNSRSLVLTWQVAAIEARNLGAPMIEPTHPFLGCCKVVDLDLPAFISKKNAGYNDVLEEALREVRKIRTIFQTLNVNAMTLRRRLRQVAAQGRRFPADAGVLHRSDASKEIFSQAEQLAQVGDALIYPIHLLYAVLIAEDEARDEVLSELKIDKQRLQELLKTDLFLRAGKSASLKSNTKAKWN